MEQEHTYSFKESIQNNCVRFRKSQRVYLRLKRVLDVLFSACGLIVLIPFFLVVALAIKLEDPRGKVIFSQERIGRKGIPFKLYKFRSMRMNAPELSTHEFKNSGSYITKVGKILRKTSIDELPQLWNVFIGDMSLVGPRPLLPRERNVHIKRFRYGLYQVRPGITGMAQTHGRDDMNDHEKVLWDKIYVENISIFTDALLLVRTVRKVIMREGVAEQPDPAEQCRKDRDSVISGVSNDLAKEKSAFQIER